MADLSPLIVRGSRRAMLKPLLICIAFLAMGFWIIVRGPFLLGVFEIAVFGACTLLLLARLVSPGRLMIDESGFSWRGAFKSWHVPWAQVAQFRTLYARRSSSVLIDYVANAGSNTPLSWIAPRPRAVPGLLELTPTALQEMLQGRLEAARGPHEDGSIERIVNGASTVPVLEPHATFPLVSLGILAVLSAVFAGEIVFPITEATKYLQPSTTTLVGFGGTSWQLVIGDREFYRLLTAPFLHGNLPHILGNGIALVLAGRLLEGLVGRIWFVSIYAVGAVSGSIASVAINNHNTVGVGASGAIMALFAALYICSFHFPQTSARGRFQARAIGVLVPTLLTIGKTSGGMTIDFGAHLGGALGGALIGLYLLWIWRGNAAIPPQRRLAITLACGGGLAMVACLVPAAHAYLQSRQLAELIPDSERPQDDASFVSQAAELERRYPGDPRPHLIVAMQMVDQRKGPEAEKEARIGLSNTWLLHQGLDPIVESNLWLALGEAARLQGRTSDAADAYDKAQAAAPANAVVDIERARLMLSEGDVNAANHAIQKFVSRKPEDAAGFDVQGDILFASGDLHGAVENYGAALNKQPSLALTLFARGVAKFLSSDRSASADLDGALRMQPSDLYMQLWSEIAGAGDARHDPPLDRPNPDAPWPAPILRLYLGDLTPDALLGLAKPGMTAGTDQVCEARVYAAEWDWMHGRSDDGRALMDRASTECPPMLLEAWVAKAETKSPAVHAHM